MKSASLQSDPNMDGQAIIQAACADVKKIADTFETVWGEGVLPTLCGEFVLAHMRNASQELRQAIADKVPSIVVEKARAVIDGWQHMDRAAKDRGHVPSFWEREPPPKKAGEVDWSVGDEIPFGQES